MSETLVSALSRALGRSAAPASGAATGGDSNHHCLRFETGDGPVFVKRAPLARADQLESEADGLECLRQAGAVRVPATLALGRTGAEAFLALEWLELSAPDEASEQRLGEALAWLHRSRGPAFGHVRDNWIGGTPQANEASEDWVGFWRRNRLIAQLDLAAANGYAGRLQDRGRRLADVMEVFFSTYRPAASLLHGDLWGGNRGALTDGTPVIFDPAVYYGDREADLAMTRLFGGFGPRFYSAYAATWPLDQAAGTRRDLYNLYHVLNHLNLFGGAYLAQAEGMTDQLLAAAGH